MREQRVRHTLHEIAANEVPDSLDLWPAIEPRLRRQPQLLSPLRQAPISRLVWVGAALVLMFGIALAVSPGALAQVGDIVRRIGTMTFFERDRYPDELSGRGVALSPHGMSLAEARAQLPFSIKVPTWTPEGYAPGDQVTVSTGTASKGCTENCSFWEFSMSWRKPLTSSDPRAEYMANWVSLDIAYPSGVAMKVKTGSVDDVLINGKPTALVRGIWDRPSQQWVAGNMTSVIWTEDMIFYELRAGKGVSRDDLIRMAATIR